MKKLVVNHVPVDPYHVEQVRDVIEQLTAPMGTAHKEVLSMDQVVLLKRLSKQLDKWIADHTLST